MKGKTVENTAKIETEVSNVLVTGQRTRKPVGTLPASEGLDSPTAKLRAAAITAICGTESVIVNARATYRDAKIPAYGHVMAYIVTVLAHWRKNSKRFQAELVKAGVTKACAERYANYAAKALKNRKLGDGLREAANKGGKDASDFLKIQGITTEGKLKAFLDGDKPNNEVKKVENLIKAMANFEEGESFRQILKAAIVLCDETDDPIASKEAMELFREAVAGAAGLNDKGDEKPDDKGDDTGDNA